MDIVNDGDLNTSVLDVAMESALEHIHSTVSGVRSSIILTVYLGEDGEARCSAEIKGSAFEITGALQFWIAHQLRVPSTGGES